MCGTDWSVFYIAAIFTESSLGREGDVLACLGKTTVVSFLCRENLSGDMLGGSLGSRSPMPAQISWG